MKTGNPSKTQNNNSKTSTSLQNLPG